MFRRYSLESSSPTKQFDTPRVRFLTSPLPTTNALLQAEDLPVHTVDHTTPELRISESRESIVTATPFSDQIESDSDEDIDPFEYDKVLLNQMDTSAPATLTTQFLKKNSPIPPSTASSPVNAFTSSNSDISSRAQTPVKFTELNSPSQLLQRKREETRNEIEKVNLKLSGMGISVLQPKDRSVEQVLKETPKSESSDSSPNTTISKEDLALFQTLADRAAESILKYGDVEATATMKKVQSISVCAAGINFEDKWVQDLLERYSDLLVEKVQSKLNK